jgi:PiT family inorganic phosphate transporter
LNFIIFQIQKSQTHFFSYLCHDLDGIDAGCCIFAYSNGANDNIKGFATLYGSRKFSYKRAITFVKITTFLGSLAEIILAVSLVKSFSGSGLVPDRIVVDSIFAVSVALDAALTVIFATKIGMPVSNTHAMVGAVLGVAANYLMSWLF